MTRSRRVASIKRELLAKSREAALASVQIFNNPLIHFKSEMFIVNMIIAWTYLLHAYYRGEGIDYRYYEISDAGRKRYDRTKRGAYKYWELERCLNDENTPVGRDAANNIRFLIGLRHEIEHQMTSRLDGTLSARYQACSLNYNELIKSLFGDEQGIDKYLSFSLQFSSLADEQINSMNEYGDILPGNIARFIEDYDGSLSQDEYNSPKYAYRVLYTQKKAGSPGKADQVIEFVKPGTEMSDEINKAYAAIKETEKTKYRPTRIVEMMQDLGYSKFRITEHIQLWKSRDAKNINKGYGIEVEGGGWFWYESWLTVVRQHCASNKVKYGYKND